MRSSSRCGSLSPAALKLPNKATRRATASPQPVPENELLERLQLQAAAQHALHAARQTQEGCHAVRGAGDEAWRKKWVHA